MDGYKKQDTFRSGHSSVSYLKEKVCKGTLLVALSHEESRKIASHLHHVHNYKSLANMAVSLYCDARQVRQITRDQRDMLHGVRKLEVRIDMLHEIDWVSSLILGSCVYVYISNINTHVRGVVRHIGKLPGEIGTMYGVELMVCMNTCVFV